MVFRSLFNRKEHKKLQQTTNKGNYSIKISKNLQTNLDNLTNMLDDPDDLKVRQLKLGTQETKCAIVYISGLVDNRSLEENVISNLQHPTDGEFPNQTDALFDFIYWKLISEAEIQESNTFDDISYHLLSGYSILLLDGLKKVLLINTVGGNFRSIEEPISETLIRGPREGFIENIQVNLAILRRNLKDQNLRFKTYKTGRRSKKNLVLAYVEGITHPELIQEVERRLQSIDIDFVPESGYIEEWLEDSYLSPFPQLQNTERPDRVIGGLMQGKIAILLDGTPFVLLAPVVFTNVLQSPEDYYARWTIGTLLRMLRYLGAFLSVFLPALYIALVSVQPSMIPTDLAFSIALTRQGVPFPPVIEALLMIVTMELLQEAGARLPQTIGQTIGIVGGLVIGEAAVQAGVVSPIMVIVVALTAIANFSIPSFSVAISFRIIRFAFMFAAAIFGLYGIILMYIVINIHMVNLKSFGVPYTAPFAPFFKDDWKDVIIRTPVQTLGKRPAYSRPLDDISVDRKGEQQ